MNKDVIRQWLEDRGYRATISQWDGGLNLRVVNVATGERTTFGYEWGDGEVIPFIERVLIAKGWKV